MLNIYQITTMDNVSHIFYLVVFSNVLILITMFNILISFV